MLAMTIDPNQFGVESWISPGTAAGGNAAGGGTATGAGGISSESCGRPIPSPGVFEAVFGTSSFSGLGAGAAGVGSQILDKHQSIDEKYLNPRTAPKEVKCSSLAVIAFLHC